MIVPDIPDEAVTAALAARRHALADRPTPTHLSDEALTRIMLEAAAPALAETVAAKILAHRDRYWPAAGNEHPDHGDVPDPVRRSLRRHFAIAARIAAGAFDTDEDRRRLAAEAIARTDYICCPPPKYEQEEGE